MVTAILLKISEFSRKIFKNLTKSPMVRLHYKYKCFSYLQCMLNGLTLLESREINRH